MPLGLGGLNAIGSMGQGLAHGMVQGTMTNRQWNQEDQARNDLQQQRQATLDQQAQAAKDKASQDKIQNIATAMRAGISAAEKSKDPGKAFTDAYKAILPDETPPSIEFKTDDKDDEVTMSMPDGMKIKGHRPAIAQAIDLISKNPGKASEIMGKLNELGLAEIEMPKPKEGKDAWTTFKGSDGQTYQKSSSGKVEAYPGQSPTEARSKIKDKQAAQSRISNIEVTLTKLKSGGISQDLLASAPELAPFASMMGQKLSPEDYKSVEKVLRSEQDDLRKTWGIGATTAKPTSTAAPVVQNKDTQILSEANKQLKGKPAGYYKSASGKSIKWDGKAATLQ